MEVGSFTVTAWSDKLRVRNNIPLTQRGGNIAAVVQVVRENDIRPLSKVSYTKYISRNTLNYP